MNLQMRARATRVTCAAMAADPSAVDAYLRDLQARICAALEAEDGAAKFREEEVAGPGGALSRPRVLEGGAVIEKAAVNFTHARGPSLPAAATRAAPAARGPTVRGGLALADRSPAQSATRRPRT